MDIEGEKESKRGLLLEIRAPLNGARAGRAGLELRWRKAGRLLLS